VPDDDVARLARFVAARNHGAERCLHLGDDVATVRRELEELETPRDRAWHLAEVDGEIVGAALVDLDEALGRAWLFGPWTADADDDDGAGRVLDAALAAVPPTVAQVDNFLDSANRRGVRLHEARGFRVERRSSILRCTARPAGAGRGVVGVPAERRAALAALHDAAFPGTWLTPAKLLEQGSGPDATLLHLPDAADAAAVLGYLLLRREPERREAVVDYVAVREDARGAGHGRALLTRAVALAFDEDDVEAVTLVVDDANDRAYGLYRSAGFELLHEGLVLRRRRPA
jgi:GNAT superfamily N-acetyltransferase